MSGIDLVIGAVIIVSAIVSFVRGFFREALSLFTWLIAILITLTYTSRFATVLPKEYIESATARAAIGAVVLFLGCLMIGGVFNWLFQKAVANSANGLFDRLFGVVFGVARGFIIVVLAVLLANLAPTLKQETWWRESMLLAHFQKGAQFIHAQLPPAIAQHFDFT